jgi:methylenetetrahydrofolate reductase (NADPH)
MAMTAILERPADTLAALLRNASLEVPSRPPKDPEALRRLLPEGADIFIGFPPGKSYHRVIEKAVMLRRAGCNPVPHIVARNLDSFTQLHDFIARAAGEAGATRALVIGGDANPPRGPYASSLDVLRTGLLQRHGILSVGLAAHPEGSPRIPPIRITGVLQEKLAVARENGLQSWIATQFCFEPEPILRWLRSTRTGGIDIPVRIGLAGPASITTLLAYGVRCGIGNSLRTLHPHLNLVTRALGDAGPDEIVHTIADALAKEPMLGPIGLHFFTFGGVSRTVQWLREAVATA